MPTLTLTTRVMRCTFGVFVTKSVAAEIVELGVETNVDGPHTTCVFRDPLDVLNAWQYLRRALITRTIEHRPRLMSALAEPDAAEMFGDPSAAEARDELVEDHELDEGVFVVNAFGRYTRFPLFDDLSPLPGGLRLAVVTERDVRAVQITQPGWIGRNPDAPIRIDADSIARRHVELGVDSHEGWFVRDAKSSGGYWIGGEKAGQARHVLHPGMGLQFGQAAVVVL